MYTTKYDLTLAKAGQTEEGVCAIERSYHKVGVGKILKPCLEYLSSYVNFSKLKTQNLNRDLNDKV